MTSVIRPIKFVSGLEEGRAVGSIYRAVVFFQALPPMLDHKPVTALDVVDPGAAAFRTRLVVRCMLNHVPPMINVLDKPAIPLIDLVYLLWLRRLSMCGRRSRERTCFDRNDDRRKF